MRYIVKRACSFRFDFVKYTEGDIVPAMKASQLKRVMHLIEPYDDETPEPAAPEPAPEPPVEAERAVEGDDAPEDTPAPKRRRRAVKKADA